MTSTRSDDRPVLPAVADRSRPEGSRLLGRIAGTGRSLVIILSLIAVWEGAVRLLEVNPLLFPTFGSVLRSLLDGLGLITGKREATGEFWHLTWVTMDVLLKSYVLAAVLAITLTSLAAGNQWGRTFLATVTGIFQPLPGIALVPLAILRFGLNTRALMFVVIMAMLWPLTGALAVGFATVPDTIVRVGQNYQLSRLAMIRCVLLPMALPAALSGARVAWGYGWRTVVGAEIVFGATGAQGGLGWFINNSRLFLDVSGALSAILVVVIIGLLTESLFQLVQNRTTKRWGMERA